MHFILLLFPLSPDKDFKHFCGYGLAQEFRHCFAELPSTSRFVALIPRLLLPFDLLLYCYRGQKTRIYFMAVKVTGGNTDDRQPLEPMTAALRGKGIADRKCPHETPMVTGSAPAHWQSPHREEPPPPPAGQVVAEKTIHHQNPLAKLKSGMKLEPSRHRSPRNVFIPILSCRAAYSLDQPKVHIGTVVIPNLCSPYPELELDKGAWWIRVMPMGM